MEDVRIRRPDDFHIHLRQGEGLADYVRDAASTFGRILVMPNTVPPIDTPERLGSYERRIRDAAPSDDYPDFAPLFAFKLRQSTTVPEVEAMKRAGAVAAKLYPEGATTNSEGGVTDALSLTQVYAALVEHDLVLCIHAEDPSAFVLDREEAYLPVVAEIHARFPSLRIVVEHVSTASAVRFVSGCENTVAASITAHHLVLTLNDVIGDGMQPHHYCKPIAKQPEDREAILAAAIGDDPRFFFGSDSAPHPRRAKENAMGAAGVYSAPVAIAALAGVFSDHVGEQWARTLERFVAERGAAFYGLPPATSHIHLRDEPWVVPAEFHGVVPLFAGRTLRWWHRG